MGCENNDTFYPVMSIGASTVEVGLAPETKNGQHIWIATTFKTKLSLPRHQYPIKMGTASVNDMLVFKGIQFQGQTGRLAISNERAIFQQEADPSARPRSWLWKTMKRYQIVFSGDCPDGKRLIKFYNQQNRWWPFWSPKSIFLRSKKLSTLEWKMATWFPMELPPALW